MTYALQSHLQHSEPELAFDPDRPGNTDVHPLRGLLRHGPYSAGLVLDPIRVATIAPAGNEQHLYRFLKRLHEPQVSQDRTGYRPDWPGFRQVFRLDLQAADASCRPTLPESVDVRARSNDGDPVGLADALTRALSNLAGRRSEFEVVFIYLPRRWRPSFGGDIGDDFDLHDHLKAIGAARNIPIQIVLEDSALAASDAAGLMWRLGLALYAKAGGIPWTLAEAEPGTAFVGLSYSVRPPEDPRSRFVTCCSQVFGAQGAGLEFLAYDAKDVEVHRDNPFLTRDEAFRVLSRSMTLYRRQHGGRSPKRVTVHKTTHFTQDEMDGAMEALRDCEEVDLIQVVNRVSWRAAAIESPSQEGGKGKANRYPVERGTLLQIGRREALQWIHGDVPNVAGSGSYFKGSRGTPQPVRLVRHAGQGSWDHIARTTLGLSKMNWNNDALYDQLPVTMSFASTLSRVVKRIPDLGPRPYQYRFFM